MSPEAKPCRCGRAGCTLTRREGEPASRWNARRHASYSCAAYAGRMAQSESARAAHARMMQRAAQEADDDAADGALVADLAWLDTPSGRIKAQRQAHGINLR